LIVSGHALKEPVLKDFGAGMENASLQRMFAIAIMTAERIGAAIIIVFRDIAVAMEPVLKMIQIIRVCVATGAFHRAIAAQMMIARAEENAFLVKLADFALPTAQTTNPLIAVGLVQICRPTRITAETAKIYANRARNALMVFVSIHQPVQMKKTAHSRITNARELTAPMENASLETSRIQHHATMEILVQRMTSVHMEYVKPVSPRPVLKEMNAAPGHAQICRQIRITAAVAARVA
jgi:hypothetical protein